MGRIILDRACELQIVFIARGVGAPSCFSRAATTLPLKSAICASVSVAFAALKRHAHEQRIFPAGTFLPRKRSVASIEWIFADAQRLNRFRQHREKLVPSASSREKSRSTLGNLGNGSYRAASFAQRIAV